MTGPDGRRRTLVLTGASQGIGHATAGRFARAGWRVITCARSAFSPACPWEGGEEDHVQIDLADAEGMQAGIEELRSRVTDGHIDALVNNAGLSPKADDGERLDSVNTDLATWHQVFQVNFYAPLMMARGLLSELRAARGTVLNVTSIAGGRVHPFAGTAYATSKAALAALTREMAADLGPHGVRVNAIAPGEIETPILSPGSAELADTIPLRRLGHASEVADTIFYLCSEGASYVSGTEVHINGGQHV